MQTNGSLENRGSPPPAPLPDPLPGHRLRLENIQRAACIIDPVFRNSPQYNCEPLSDALGCQITLKLETANPIRSFKGRGASFLIRERLRQGALNGRQIVAASAGNWGQALAYACRSEGLDILIHAATTANALKVERMRALGATIRLFGDDFDAAKSEASRFAQEAGALMLADGLDPEAAEGAGTIAMELLQGATPPEMLIVPLGNGALLTGIARWAKAMAPGIKVIGVQSTGADAMEKSWRKGSLVFPPAISTIADGIGVRVPIAEAVNDMNGIVDDVHLVEDRTIIAAMRLLFQRAGLVIEPSGAAGVAAVLSRPEAFVGRHVAIVLCGGNLTGQQVSDWLS